MENNKSIKTNFMKKLIILLGGILFVLILSLLTSCNNESNIQENPTQIKIDGLYGRIYIIDGCEYYKFGIYDQSWGTHKGNCKNPIHNQYKPIPLIYHIDSTIQIFPIDSVIVKENKIFCFTKGKLKFVSGLKKRLLIE